MRRLSPSSCAGRSGAALQVSFRPLARARSANWTRNVSSSSCTEKLVRCSARVPFSRREKSSTSSISVNRCSLAFWSWRR
ncbi:hypothetical protein D3C75_917320 [compost metagenome]